MWAVSLAAALFATATMVGPKAFGATNPCATSTTASGSGSTTLCISAVRMDRSTLRHIADVVRRQAVLLGDAHPHHVNAVVATLGAATQLTGASIRDGAAAIFFVQARGNFVCRSSCFGPGPGPRGRFLTLGLDIDTLDVRSFGLQHAAVKLRSLGHVYHVPIK
jgi:hypothetical protein